MSLCQELTNSPFDISKNMEERMSCKRLNQFNDKLIESSIVVKSYPEMVFFIGLNVEVYTAISPLAFSIACSSLSPTTESGGML